MIDYSPHTKYTAQKIQDKVTRGAYFYSSFSIDNGISSTTNIEKLINKLTMRYDLNLTSRQRNYRLKTGRPIADLIVQDVIYENRWQFILLITTPNSHMHSKQLELSNNQCPQNCKDKIVEVKEISFDKESVHSEINLIHEYFIDEEPLKFVMHRPYLELDFAGCSAELVRMTHKKYKPSSEKFYRVPKKSFSWTWRWKKEVVEQKKRELINIINRYVSQVDKTRPYQDILNWQFYFQTYAVFRGMRQQVGRLYTLGKLFLYSRSKKSWDNESLPNMTLFYLPRLKHYAESYNEYYLRREIYVNYGVEIPKEIVQDWNKIDLFLSNIKESKE